MFATFPILQRSAPAIAVLLAVGVFWAGCGEQPPSERLLPSGTVVSLETDADYVEPADPERVHTILFAKIAPRFYEEKAEYFAEIGIDGIMLAGIWHNWSSDVWQQPHSHFDRDVERGRFVGEQNVMFQRCKSLNARCREVGIDYNSIKVAFYKPLPDWFDDEAWARVVENFRQGAVFAREAGFAGVTLDIEYINQIYELDYEAYLEPGYPRDQMREKARQRGYEIMSAMLDEFPEMIFWNLPEGHAMYGPLASDIIVGLVSAMAENDAPGGFHLSTEHTYKSTNPMAVMAYVYETESTLRDTIAALAGEDVLNYWDREGTIAPGLWPLGYYRSVKDEVGEHLGYSGREKVYGATLVGSYADHSANYGPEEFRAQFAAARMVADEFVWIYGHGRVLWEMTPEEQIEYHGAVSDTASLDDELDRYIQVLQEREEFATPTYQSLAEQIRGGVARLAIPGVPGGWYHIGPFPHRSVEEYVGGYRPESHVDFAERYEGYKGLQAPDETLAWEWVPQEDLYVDLRHVISDRDSVMSYSVVDVEADEVTTAYIGFGSNDRGAISVNGTEIYSYLGERSARLDDEIMVVHLPQGRSRIKVKVGDTGGSNYGFYFRLMNEDFGSVEGVRYVKPGIERE